jgi:hypothetical protein
VHCGSTLQFVRSMPSEANLSICGVGAPLNSPPPYTPKTNALIYLT